MLERDGYPAGVPCWIDVVQPDPDATMAFYGDLFGWTYEVRTPEGAPQRYAYARLDGSIVGGLGGPPSSDAERSGWTSYIWVDSTDATIAVVEANGGKLLIPPVDIPRAGRPAVCADPEGAVFGLWQAGENRGAQVVNAPGSWNFSELYTNDLGGAEAFYGAVFGWELDTLEMGGGQKAGMWRLPGYGDFLARRDPEIRARQEADDAPTGFADAVALAYPLPTAAPADRPHWGVTFAVADADAAFARAQRLGASVVVPLLDTDYTRMGVVRDPQGAELTLSEYRPPSAG
jgi:predicted enzyme related to lactoylglutathione lyase